MQTDANIKKLAEASLGISLSQAERRLTLNPSV